MDITLRYNNSHCIFSGQVHTQGKKNRMSDALLAMKLLPALPSGPLRLLLGLSAAGMNETYSPWTST